MYKRINNTNASTASPQPHRIYEDAFFAAATSQLPWDQRINKAGYFSSYNELRRVVWDQAVLRPDLIDAPMFVNGVQWPNLVPWNAKSQEPPVHR